MLLRVIFEVACAVAVVYCAYCIVYNLANGLYRRCERASVQEEKNDKDGETDNSGCDENDGCK